MAERTNILGFNSFIISAVSSTLFLGVETKSSPVRHFTPRIEHKRSNSVVSNGNMFVIITNSFPRKISLYCLASGCITYNSEICFFCHFPFLQRALGFLRYDSISSSSISSASKIQLQISLRRDVSSSLLSVALRRYAIHSLKDNVGLKGS